MKRIHLLVSTSLFACVVVAQPAFAQSAPVQGSASATSQAPQQLQEVMVTAEHRTSTAQHTAASISVRSGRDMLLQGRYELKDILEDVPGVVGGAATSTATSQGSGTDNPASGLVIRGVQSNDGAGGSVTSTASAAAIYVDEVYNGIGGGYDLDRVEVLRGPQGTLYGRSATAGVVAIHTADPNTHKVSGDAAAEYGNYGLRHYTGDLNIPIIKDTLAVRVAGNLYKRDGYYSADGGMLSNSDYKVKALYTPTDNFSALLGYAEEYGVTHSGGVSINQVSSPTSFTFAPAAVAQGKNNFHQYWGNFNLTLGPVGITYIPAYRTWYENAVQYLRSAPGTVGFNANQYINVPTDHFLTQEVRIHNADNGARLKWQAGFLYYDNTLIDSDSFYQLPNGPYAFQSASHKSTSEEGGFAEATYAFLPDTRLTGGVRYDHTRILNTGAYSAFGGPFQPLTAQEGLRIFNNFTYKVKLEHDITPRNLVYGSISTGFSPGDVTQTTVAKPIPVPPFVMNVPGIQTLQTETLTAYELGSKNRFLQNRLQVNGDVYYYDYGAFQTAGINTNPQNPLAPTFITLAAPMKSYGVELEVVARPWADGTFTANASYTHARYGSFGQYQDLFSQSTVAGVAPFQGSVAYDHSILLGTTTLMLHADVHFFTSHDTSFITTDQQAAGGEPLVQVPSEAIGDVSGTLLFGPNSNYSVTAYVRNVADARYIPDGWVESSSVVGGTTTFTENGVTLSDPRTYGVVLDAKF